VREALSEGLLFPYLNLNKRPEFAEAPAIGGGALTTERRANGQALGRADNIKRDRANVYLTHTVMLPEMKGEEKYCKIVLQGVFSCSDKI